MAGKDNPNARPLGPTKAEIAKTAQDWSSLEVCADLDEDVVVEALAELLWSVQKSHANTGGNRMGSRESNR